MRKSGLQLGDYPNLIASSIVQQLSKREHPLARMPYYDQSTHPEVWREEILASERYKELVDRYCTTFNVDKSSLNPMGVMMSAGSANFIATNKESGKRKELASLAEKIVREDWNLDYNEVLFDLEILEPGEISLPEESKMESPLNDEDKEYVEAELSDEVVKRRTINAFAQGAALKGHYLFHLYSEQIEAIVPDVITFYQKALCANDLFYYMISDDMLKQQIESSDQNNAGYFMLDFEGEIPKIIVKAINLPILIHEMKKGLISLFAVPGLPEEDSDKVIDYADTIISELWDIRLFPNMWANLHSLIDPDDYDVKKLILIELFKKPADEFIYFMSLLEHNQDQAKKEIEGIVKQKRREIMEYNFMENDFDGFDLSNLGL